MGATQERVVPLTLSHLVVDAPARGVQEPAFERADFGIVFESCNSLGNGNERFLDDFLRLDLSQPRFARNTVNESPIKIEKLAPTFCVVAIFQPAEQAPPRRDKLRLVCPKRKLHPAI